ncbi:MAG TPA: DUF3014 domain-containing protein [Anaeromyxobacter sp.]|nr:DUF3014 domain-containing protein [Anaeromyxobacter sp.]
MEPTEERRKLGKGEWAAIGVAAVILGALGVLWLRRGPEPAPPPAPPPSEPAAAAAPGGPVAPSGPAPALDEARIRELLLAVSTDRLFRKGLELGDVVRRWVIVTDNLAEGVSPRKQLDFLVPAQPFSTTTHGGRLVIAPESYARYDAFGDAVATLDAAAFARAYTELKPVLEPAYRALGYPGASLDRVTARALRRLEAAPVRDGPVALEANAGVYLFADGRLEDLGAVEKHLLRMGPRNTRLVQAKARELEKTLGLTAVAVDHKTRR